MIETVKDIIIKKLKEYGIKKWDLFITKTYTVENQFRKTDIEITRDYELIEYVIRIFRDKEKKMGIGVVKGSSIEEQIISNTIKNASKIAEINSTVKYDLNPSGLKYKKLSLADKEIISNPFDFIYKVSDELTTEILNNKGIQGTFGKFRVYIQDRRLINSVGLDIDSKTTFMYLEYALKASKKGKLAEYWTKSYYKNAELLKLPSRINLWARIAEDTLNAIKPPFNKSATVLFPPRVLKDAFRNTLGFHITGKSVVEKISKFKIGDTIASEKFTMNDNGLLLNGMGTNSWDGEGTPQKITPVIKNGKFNSRIYDIKHARLLDEHSTGNGIRTSEGSVENLFTNIEIDAGKIKLDEIISETSEGFLIEEFSWLNPNRITGDFGAEIRNGYIIKNGEISSPIKGGNISGNVFEMINNIENISIEREFEENTLFPYIQFNNLIISS